MSGLNLPIEARAAILERRAHLERLCSGNDLTAWYEPRSGWSYMNEARRDEIRWIDSLLDGAPQVERPEPSPGAFLDMCSKSKTVAIDLEWESRL